MKRVVRTRAMQEVDVLSWNLLAHVHTHWNFSEHGGTPRSLETEEQRQARHLHILRRLNALRPAVVLLQEVDATFMPQDWQPASGPLPCGQRLEGYTPYRSYTPPWGPRKHAEGTAVLLRDDAWVRDKTAPKALIASSEETGWKTGMVVHACPIDAPERSVAFASVHLRHGAPPRQQALLAMALAARRDDSTPMVLGGDFNATPTVIAREQIDLPLRQSGLSRVATPEDAPTNLHCGQVGCGQVIDHLYSSTRVDTQSAVEVGRLPLSERGPWGDPEADGSDHAWVRVRLALETEKGKAKAKATRTKHEDNDDANPYEKKYANSKRRKAPE